jgi:hypothetical protein
MTLQTDDMRRTVAALVMMLVILPALPRSEAAGASEHWDSGRVLRANLTVPALVDLQVGPGVNISFEPDLKASVFSEVALEVSGGFEVCGTSERPAAFTASNESLFTLGELGGYILINGNGEPGQVEVRNSSFENLVLFLNGSAGRFRDCSFDTSYVFLMDASVAFTGCSFRLSAVSIFNTATLNRTSLSRCTFNSSRPGQWDLYPEYFYYTPAVRISGYAGIYNCTISDYFTGIESSSGLPVIEDCLVEHCQQGMRIDTTDPADTPLVADCTVRNCTGAALMASGNLVVRNCTLTSSRYGLELYGSAGGARPNWTLAGNRIFGNQMYGVLLHRAEAGLGDTRFDDGAGNANRAGRVEKRTDLGVEAATRGKTNASRIEITLTDALGNRVHRNGQLDYPVVFHDIVEYSVDNSGARTAYFPRQVLAEAGGLYCETTVEAGTANVTLLLTIPVDLVPASVSLDPPRPRAGDWVAITCLVNNTGPVRSPRVLALFTLDGERLDQTDLFPVDGRSGSAVRAVDWRARAGLHTLTVRLDSLGAAEEMDESNNNLTINFTVREAPPKPPAAPDIAYAGGAAAAILGLSVAGAVLFRRRKRRAGGG